MEEEEKTNNMSNLVQISEIDEEIYVNLNCIRGIEKVDHHPGTNETNGWISQISNFFKRLLLDLGACNY